MKLNYLDLFSGIGGFHLGLLQAGFSFNWVGFSEIDKYAIKTYKKHFPDSEELGDVRTIRPERLPKIHLITFGFPCQDLSIAGKRKGIKAERSGLFFEAMRIVRATKPDYFIFENVKGLLTISKGRDFITVLREIADSGYDGQWQLLNTRWFLPQNRERIYFIGHIRGACRPEIFPLGEGNTLLKNEENKKQRKKSWISSTIDSRYGALRNAGETYIVTGKRIRKFTPMECERLQGFPNGWTEGLTDTQRYKCIGNAVSVPVVEAIGRKLFNYLLKFMEL